jgi:hypothetical protein
MQPLAFYKRANYIELHILVVDFVIVSSGNVLQTMFRFALGWFVSLDAIVQIKL